MLIIEEIHLEEFESNAKAKYENVVDKDSVIHPGVNTADINTSGNNKTKQKRN